MLSPVKWLVFIGLAICTVAQQPEMKKNVKPEIQAAPSAAPSPSDTALAGGKTPQKDSSLWDAKTIVAICALVTSIYFSVKAREHNRLSVRPMPYILQPDYQDRIAVIVQNNGTGPLILQKAEARLHDRVGHLIDLMPPLPRHMSFRNFNRIVQRRPIRPGDQVDLLEIAVNPNEDAAADYRDKLRDTLGDVTVELTYTDVYGSRFDVYSVKLDWFHRHRHRS